MKKYSETIKRIMKAPLGFSIVSNVFTIILGLLIFRPFFEENDDLGLSFIAEGAYGNNDYHLIFSSTILGRFEVMLCRLISAVRWHVVLQYIFIFAAFFIVTYYLSHFKMGRMASFVLQLACFYELYVSLQFTKTAAFVSVAAMMVILGIVKMKLTDDMTLAKTEQRALLICSYIVMAYGMLLRKEAFEISALIAAAAGVIDAFGILREKGFRILGKYAAYVLPAFAALLIFTLIDNAAYNPYPEWNMYREYNAERGNMVDRHPDALQYDVYGDELAELGVSENDAYMYVTWQFGDESVCTSELMKNISSITTPVKVDIDFLKEWIRNIYDTLFVFNPVIISFIALTAIAVMASAWKSRGTVLLCFEGILTCFLLFYYQYASRWNHRLVYATLMSLMAVEVFTVITEEKRYFDPDGKKKTGIQAAADPGLKIILFTMAVTAVFLRLGNEFDYQEYLRKEQNFSVLQMYMAQEKDTLFVADTFTGNEKYKYDVFGAVEKGALDNYVDAGGWLTASPFLHEITEKYGYYDAFDALKRGSENVVLIDNNFPDRKALYLTEHGDGPRYAAEYLENVCGYNLYKIK